MPTPRRKSVPAPQPSSPLSPLPTHSARPTRSTSTPARPRTTTSTSTPTTPQTPHHHHKTADELTLLEAQRILQATPLSTHSHHDLRTGISERDKRHWKLEEAREAVERDDGRSVNGSRKGSESVASGSGGNERKSENERKISLGSEEEEVLLQGNENGNLGTGLDGPATESRGESVPKVGDGVDELLVREGTVESVGTEELELPREMMEDQAAIVATTHLLSEDHLEGNVLVQDFAQNQVPENDEMDGDDIRPQDGVGEHDDDDGSEGESSDTSDSSGSSSTSDTSDGDDSETDEEEEDEAMERLLEAAKRAAIAKSGDKGKEKEVEVTEGDDEVVLQFDGSEGKRSKQAPIPDLSIPTLPKPHLTFDSHGAAHASTTLPQLDSQAGPSQPKGRRQIIDESQLERDDRPYEKQLSKREKKAQPKKATPSELWASIPSARADRLPQMKRDYQALALAASLDPKRFMKGGKSATTKVPELFAIGTMVDPPRHLQDTTIQREAKYRPGQVVENLARNEDVGGYAKRKYGDLQGVRMDNGRGKGWKKRTKW